MSWNLSLKINNLIQLVNSLLASSVSNPLTSNLNCTNGATSYNINGVNTLQTTNIKDTATSTGTAGSVLVKNDLNNLVWSGVKLQQVFYVSPLGTDVAGYGSQTLPYQTIQYAINQCTNTSNYYTIYITPGTYTGNLTISGSLSPRINIIGMQSQNNSKSVVISGGFILSLSVTGGNETNNIISLQNMQISNQSANEPIHLTTGGGYSLYLNNLEMGITSNNAVRPCLYFEPTVTTTRLYVLQCNMNNVSTSGNTSVIIINNGQLWAFYNNNITNNSTTGLCIDIISPALNIGGFNSCYFSSSSDICARMLIANSSSAVAINNTTFIYTSLAVLNTNACLVLGNQNSATIFTIDKCSFGNLSAVLANAQTPFIIQNGCLVYATNNNFGSGYISGASNIVISANYGTNSTSNYFRYSGNYYANGLGASFTTPVYPTSFAGYELNQNDAQQITKLTNLATTTDTNLITYNSTTKTIGYKAITTGGISSVTNGTTYASGYLASIAGNTITINTPNQNLNTTGTPNFTSINGNSGSDLSVNASTGKSVIFNTSGVPIVTINSSGLTVNGQAIRSVSGNLSMIDANNVGGYGYIYFKGLDQIHPYIEFRSNVSAITGTLASGTSQFSIIHPTKTALTIGTTECLTVSSSLLESVLSASYKIPSSSLSFYGLLIEMSNTAASNTQGALTVTNYGLTSAIGNTNGLMLLAPNMGSGQIWAMWLGSALDANKSVSWTWQTTNPSGVYNSMRFAVYAGSYITWIGSYGITINTGAMPSQATYQIDLATDNARKLTTSTWATGSDERIKQNIIDANLEICYNNVKNLKLKYFKWDKKHINHHHNEALKEKDKKTNNIGMNPQPPDETKIDNHSIGFIAQEVKKVFPKAVSTSSEYGYDDFHSLNSDQIWKSMYGAVQQLQNMVETLQNKVNILEQQLKNK